MTAALDIPQITSEDSRYDAARTGFKTNGVPRPEIVVAARDAADVQAAVALAAERGLAVSVQASGHGMPETGDGGVLITTDALDAVTVDAERRVARIEAGVRWGAVVAAAAEHGLAPLNGSSPGVGAVSYTLGGGIGLLARTHGWAADHVHAIDVVTPDAQLRHVTDGELFWALRGGRANFGVVVAIEVALFDVATIYGGGLFFDAAHAREVVRAWRDWSAAAPETLTTSIARYPMPPAPFVPEPLRGREIVHVRVADTSVAGGAEHLARMRELPGLRLDGVAEMPYAECASIYSDPTEPASYVADHVLLDALTDATIDAILATPSRAVVEVRALGGALAREPRVPSAVGHRGKPWMLGTVTPAPLADTQTGLADQAALMARVAPWTDGARTLNFLVGSRASAENVRAAYEPGDYARLQRIKAELDPANLLRHNHNIAPARG